MRTLPALTGDQLEELSTHPFHWEAARLALEAVSGQAAHFARTGTKAALDSAGVSRSVVEGQEAWEWVDLDADSVRETPGLLMGSGDTCWWDFLLHPTAITLYVEFVQPAAFPPAVKGLIYLGNAADTGARVLIESSGTQYRMILGDGVSGRTSALTGTAPTAGQRVQLRGTLTAAGVIQLHQSIDGAPETDAASDAALALKSSWGGQRVYLNSRGSGSVGGALYLDAKVAIGAPSIADLGTVL